LVFTLHYSKQEINAEILDDVSGALWTRALLDRCRLRDASGRLIHANPDRINRASERTRGDDTERSMCHPGVT
jgi:hypothetical protein